MTKKGFSLVELLGVIIILAIIILIATTGYGKIENNVKQKSYDNLINLIETKASIYAEETGNLITNVDTLMKQGYIEASNEAGDVFDPRDGTTRLNCHIVSILNDQNLYYGKYSDEEEKNEDGSCEFKREIINTNLNVNTYKTSDTTPNYNFGEKLENNKWTNTNVYLEVIVGEKIKEDDVSKITFSDAAFIDKDERVINENNSFQDVNKKLIQTNEGGVINATYYVSIELKNKTVHQTNVVVKIDKERPIVYHDLTTINEETEWTNHRKEVTVHASDLNGSGIYGYAITKDNYCPSQTYSVVENGTNPNIFKTKLASGDYYVCVKDIAGNYSEDYSTKKISIWKVDLTAPSCGDWLGESESWTGKDRTISVGCTEGYNERNSIGCASATYSTTYSHNTKTATTSITIRDKVGNSRTCSKQTNIYVDKCTEYGNKIYGSWGSCSKSCGGGHKSRSWKQVSTFGSGFTCHSGSESTSCNTSACEDSGDGDSSGGGSSGGSGGSGCNSCNSSGSSSCCGPGSPGPCSSTCTTSDHTCPGNEGKNCD